MIRSRHLSSLIALAMIPAIESHAATELELLRDRCAQQELEIQRLQQELAHHKDSKETVKPVDPVSAKEAAAPQSAPSHIVRAGESLEAIARNAGCSPSQLAKLNGLKLTSVIHPGQTLRLPGSEAPASTSSGDTIHTITSGETLAAISRKYGVTLAALVAANPDVKPTALRPGQKIRIPKVPSPAPADLGANSGSTTISTTKSSTAPAPAEAPPTKIQTVVIEKEVTFGEFAASHGTDTQRLNDLNGLDLTHTVVLARGSELYVPTQR